MKSKRAVSVLAIAAAMGMALVATPTLARQPSSTVRAYRTPVQPTVVIKPTVVPKAPKVKTGGGGMYAQAGTKPVVSSAPSHGSGASTGSARVSSLPATGGAAH
jgi:hypothetical protein